MASMRINISVRVPEAAAARGKRARARAASAPPPPPPPPLLLLHPSIAANMRRYVPYHAVLMLSLRVNSAKVPAPPSQEPSPICIMKTSLEFTAAVVPMARFKELTTSLFCRAPTAAAWFTGAPKFRLMQKRITAGAPNSNAGAEGKVAVAHAVADTVLEEDNDARELVGFPERVTAGDAEGDIVPFPDSDAEPVLVLEGVAEGAARVTPPPSGAEAVMVDASVAKVVPVSPPAPSLFQLGVLVSTLVKLIRVCAIKALSAAGELSVLARTVALLL